jgi:hypothetical protein
MSRGGPSTSNGPRSNHGGQHQATTTKVPLPQRAAPASAATVLYGRRRRGTGRLVPATRSMPRQRGHHHEQAERGCAAAPRTRRCEASIMMIPATSTAGPAVAFTDIAVCREPGHTPPDRRGWWRYRASATRRDSERGSVGVHRTGDPEHGPLVATVLPRGVVCERGEVPSAGVRRDGDPGCDREHASDGAKADQVAEPHQGEEQCSLAREHIAER